jgi:Domain of unknown function (DUF4145)
MSQPSYPPELAKSEFSCAYCGVYSAQAWCIVAGRQGNWREDQGGPQPHSMSKAEGGTHHFAIEPFNTTQNGKRVGMAVGGKAQTIPKGDDGLLLHDYYMSVCFHCSKASLWERDRMVCPSRGGVEQPNPDLNADIQADYLEAASIVQQSPRAAAAILRMCIQKMTRQLGLPGKNINDDIATLVQQGLNPEIQQALDVVRVVGNNAVHPLEMDLKDDLHTANALFGLVNFIADQMITYPKKRAALFSALPQGALAGIAKRVSDRADR